MDKLPTCERSRRGTLTLRRTRYMLWFVRAMLWVVDGLIFPEIRSQHREDVSSAESIVTSIHSSRVSFFLLCTINRRMPVPQSLIRSSVSVRHRIRTWRRTYTHSRSITSMYYASAVNTTRKSAAAREPATVDRAGFRWVLLMLQH